MAALDVLVPQTRASPVGADGCVTPIGNGQLATITPQRPDAPTRKYMNVYIDGKRHRTVHGGAPMDKKSALKLARAGKAAVNTRVREKPMSARDKRCNMKTLARRHQRL